jgi:uncharacterized protein YndB with AHSA1/START domain
MKTPDKTKITVSAAIKAPVDKVWKFWTTPEDITQWNNATDDWHTPSASNDLRKDGEFHYKMEAKNGSFGFDFFGVYDEIKPEELIAYTLGDGRKVIITFKDKESETEVVEIFEAETKNDIDKQQKGWQSILNNFKKYAETKHGRNKI